MTKIHKLYKRLEPWAKLSKIRIALAVSFTTATAYWLFQPAFTNRFWLAIAGVFFLAIGASVFNQLQEMKFDQLMPRTRQRPLPTGIIARKPALFFGFIMLLFGFYLLQENSLTAVVLGGITLIWYNLFYTPLKRITALAFVPGGVVGALPPLIGWVYAGGVWWDPQILVLALFIFLVQIPHFLIIQKKYAGEYCRAGFPTLHERYTEKQIDQITGIWICITTLSVLAFPLYHLLDSRILYLLLMLLVIGVCISVWLIIQKTQTHRMGSLINHFLLAVFLLLWMDRIL